MDSKDGKKRILIITASVGAGHNSAAYAIESQLNNSSNDIEVKVIDSNDFLPKAYRTYYSWGFKVAMSRLPFLYGLGFKMTNLPDTPRRTLTERFRLWREGLALNKLVDFFLEYKPDAVINTHFIVPPILSRLIKEKNLDTKQYIMVTDYGIHRFWYCENIDHWFLPGTSDVPRLKNWEIPDEDYTVSGMAIHPKWTLELDRQKILDEWNLPSDKPVVVLTGGTDFTCGPVVQTAEKILNLCPEICLIVLGGRNKKLLGQLTKLDFPSDRLKPVSFTDKVHELIDVASIVVTKPGGISTSEGIAKGKTMILSNPVHGQESANADYCESNNAALVARKYDQIPTLVRNLLDNPQKMQQLSQNAKSLYNPGTEIICKKVLADIGC